MPGSRNTGEKCVDSRNIWWWIDSLLVGSSCGPSYCYREDGHVGGRDGFIKRVSLLCVPITKSYLAISSLFTLLYDFDVEEVLALLWRKVETHGVFYCYSSLTLQKWIESLLSMRHYVKHQGYGGPCPRRGFSLVRETFSQWVHTDLCSIVEEGLTPRYWRVEPENSCWWRRGCAQRGA